MKKRGKWFIYIGIVLLVIIAIGFYPESKTLDPSKWMTVTLSDTVNVPIRKLWELAGNVKLEDAAGKRNYNAMPSILKTKPLTGDFSKAGHSRIVYFSSGDTLIETIIIQKEPYIFCYEITKPSLPMKWAVYRARGEFKYSALDSNRTITEWTYSFLNRNFISKFVVYNYINSTHRLWMMDMLKSTKVQVEKAFNTTPKLPIVKEEKH